MRFLASLLMMILVAGIGAGVGLGSGLAWTTLAGTTGFEGYSGYVVALHMAGGCVLGAITGLSLALKWFRATPALRPDDRIA